MHGGKSGWNHTGPEQHFISLKSGRINQAGQNGSDQGLIK
jgi:hypothetical protein